MDIVQRKPVPSNHLASMNQKTAGRSRRPSKLVALVLGVLAVCIIGGAVVWYVRANQSPQALNTSQYQVVYLANGQAYFGKLQNTSGDYLVIKGAYTAQTVQPKTDGTTSATSTETSTTLLKVTNEVYGPDDSIAIRANQVSFWQNLRDDSKVTQALKSKQ